MLKRAVFSILFVFMGYSSVFAQGPCSMPNSGSKLGCVIPQEYGAVNAFQSVLFPVGGHPFHFLSDFGTTLKPLTEDIGRQTNLLPLASPSSGFTLTYDPSLKTFVTSTDSLGPILGERAETVGRHRLFVGFSYQYFDFNKIDGVNLHNFPAVFTHTDDDRDNSPPLPLAPINCSINSASGQNLNGCGFIRDRIDTVNSIHLKVKQYTSYVTFGLTNRIDVSIVIPIEDVNMNLASQDTIVPGTS